MQVWKAADVFVRGQSNEERGSPCIDRTYSVIEKRMAYIALADGLDSSRFSHIGAEIVTREAYLYLKTRFDELYKEEKKFVRALVLQHLISQLGFMANRLRIDINDLSSTLLFIAVKDSRVIAGHIGDGAIGFLENGRVETLSGPQGMGYAGNLFFVTSPDARGRFNVMRHEIDDTQGFILISAGSAETLFDYQTSQFTASPLIMLDSLKRYSPVKVEKALRKNLKEVLTKNTTKDCSICLLRKVYSINDPLTITQRQRRLPFLLLD